MRALIAMSGGVDSTVAAYIMKKRGFDCIGATMKLYDNEDVGVSRSRTCCSADDIADARGAADKIGIPYYVFNFKDDFNEKVIKKFVESYENGFTPNPCIDCNRYLKFERLSKRAEELECDYVVTGHYARIEEKDGRFLLRKAVNLAKDQSYVLYSMSQKELSRTVFPLGDISDKDEVRRIADEAGLVNAAKPDSQDICFVPDGDYAKVIEHYTGRKYPEGDYIDINGNVIGKHKGIIHYTIGQRRGLGIAMGRHMYVCAKDPVNNTVTLGDQIDLFKKECLVKDFNWIMYENPPKELRATVKLRYNQKQEYPCTVYPEDGYVRIVMDEPQKAVAAGQAAVVYDGDYVVGGGTII
ncbi:MAG: tRNA 2-thiouridine(34) synthase MnmA [Clostridia bacterium]|nr:tRNA 2-thiouridine(34) synthase MnmA [Clostridia bacterium]